MLRRAAGVLKPSQIWVKPDCGLKTSRLERGTPFFNGHSVSSQSTAEGG